MVQSVKLTDIGNGRDVNQDAYMMEERDYKGEHIMLAAMCDGMGGLKRGEIASNYIVISLERWFHQDLPSLLKKGNSMKEIQQVLLQQIHRLNRKLILLGEEMGDSMGSTLTLLFTKGKRFFVMNIGDSRAYWFEDQHMFVTRDHTLVAEEVRKGLLTKEEAKTDRRRHILMQCLGVTREISVDCYHGRLQTGMEFILCTDGFYGRLHEDEMYQVKTSKDEMKQWVLDAFHKVKARGELDNLSCIVVKVS